MKPWNIVFLAGFIVYLTIRGLFARRTEGNTKVVSRADLGDRIVLFVVIAGNLGLPLVYLFTSWLGFADYRLPTFVPWCGLLVMLGALWMFWRSHADLGLNWSVTLEIRHGETIGVAGRLDGPTPSTC